MDTFVRKMYTFLYKGIKLSRKNGNMYCMNQIVAV